MSSHDGSSSRPPRKDKGKGKSIMRDDPPRQRRRKSISDILRIGGRGDDSHAERDPPRHSVYSSRSDHRLLNDDDDDDDIDIRQAQIRYDEQLARHMQEQEHENSGDDEGEGPQGGEANMEAADDDDGDGDDDDNAPEAGAGAGNIYKSPIFAKHFRKVLCEVQDPKVKETQYWAYCNYCKAVYKYRGGQGYGSMSKHLRKKHPAVLGMDQTQTQLNPGMYSSQSASNTVDCSHLFSYNEKDAREAAAKFVSIESLPFQFAESLHFQDWMNKVNPSQKRISRKIMRNTIFDLYEDGKNKLCMQFKQLEHKVSICSDIWQDCMTYSSYMGITCHWIDNAWNLNKRVIAYRRFDDAHTSHNIAELIIKIAYEFSISQKIFSIGFDNASANTASIRSLILECNPALDGRYFHTRCICHIFNLCVQDGLQTFKDHITPIRNVVYYLHHNNAIRQQWKLFCHDKKLRARRFPTDITTRWNATYHMLKSTFEYKEALVEFFMNVSGITLHASHWEVCSQLRELLEVFSNATKILSGVYYPTCSKVLYYCCYIAGQFQECSSNSSLQSVICLMLQKWLKYFSTIPDIFLVAAVLNPALKYDGVCTLIDNYYESIQSIPFIDDITTLLDLQLPDPENVKSTLRLTLDSTFRYYINSYGSLVGQSSQRSRGGGTSSSASGVLARLNKLVKKSTSTSSQQSELQIYLNDVFSSDCMEDEDNPLSVDLLQWWSKRQPTYPLVCIMAKEILAVPASTVSVEQAFSSGNYMLDEKRSNLTPENLEAQILLKDWSLAEKREQEPDWRHTYNEENDSEYDL